MLPPSVPALRICGLATRVAALASNPKRSRTSGCVSTSVSVVSAPMAMPPSCSRTPFNAAMPERSMTACVRRTRFFSQSQLSCPPATSQPSAPNCAARSRALSRLSGWNSSKWGIMSRNIGCSLTGS